MFPKTKLEITEMPFEDTRNYQVNWDKAVKSFGFETKYTLDNGIKEMGEVFLNHRIKDLNNPRYSNQTFLKDLLKK